MINQSFIIPYRLLNVAAAKHIRCADTTIDRPEHPQSLQGTGTLLQGYGRKDAERQVTLLSLKSHDFGESYRCFR